MAAQNKPQRVIKRSADDYLEGLKNMYFIADRTGATSLSCTLGGKDGPDPSPTIGGKDVVNM